MKRYIVLCLVFLLTLTFVSCSRNDDVPPADDSSSTESQSSSDNPGDMGDELPVPADSALYRGEITEIRAEGDATVLVLTQAQGTDYGRGSIEATLNADTRINFDLAGLAEGDYMIVYYGVSPAGGGTPEQVTAIAAGKLASAATVVVNGSLVSMVPDQAGGSAGAIVIDRFGDMAETLTLRYDSGTGTRFYLNEADLAVGDALSILTDGGEEPMALEVRRYTEAS